MIDEEDRHPLTDLGHIAQRARFIALAGIADGAEQGRSLELGLGLLGLRIGIEQKRRPGADLCNAVLQADGAQGQTGVQIAIEVNHADGAAIPGAGALLIGLDEAHGPELRRAGHRHRPGMGEKGVERVHAVAQPALDMVDRVNEARIHLDLPSADDLNRSRIADATLVVAIHIGAHGQLRFILLRIEKLQHLFGVGDGIAAALDGARDRACLHPPSADAHEHFRAGADQEFVAPQIDEKGIGRRINRLQPARNLRGAMFGPLVEDLTRNDLEKVASDELVLGPSNEVGIFARPVVAAPWDRLARPERRRLAAAGAAFGGDAVARKGIGRQRRGCRIVIHFEDFVRQIKDEVPSLVRARQALGDRIELEGQIVAEGAKKAQAAVILGLEESDDRAKNREDRRHARALFLRDRPFRHLHGDAQSLGRNVHRSDLGKSVQGLGNKAEQDSSPRIERIDRHLAPRRGDRQGRVDEGDVLTGVAARIFVIREKDGAALVVQLIEIRLDRAIIGHGALAARHLDPAHRQIGLAHIAAVPELSACHVRRLLSRSSDCLRDKQKAAGDVRSGLVRRISSRRVTAGPLLESPPPHIREVQRRVHGSIR